MDTGAFVKDYEGPAKEVEQAVQMAVSAVSSEDPRFLEKEAPPLSEEFPEGSKVFFLGEHAYGVAKDTIGSLEEKVKSPAIGIAKGVDQVRVPLRFFLEKNI